MCKSGLKIGNCERPAVTVESNGGDLVENDSTFHTDVDPVTFSKDLPPGERILLAKLPS